MQGDLTALVGSRICHDLISPLGAIGNGVELLELSGLAASPEMALISESVAAAQARIKFFRVAYGSSDAGLPLSRNEIAGILGAVARGGRLSYHWQGEGDVPRREVKAIFLLLQCLETAMPLGGEIHVRRIATGWEIVGEADKMTVDEALWTGMLGRVRPQVTAAQVQFALLPQALAAMGKVLALKLALGRIVARL